MLAAGTDVWNVTAMQGEQALLSAAMCMPKCDSTAQHLARTAFFTSQSSVNLSNAPSTPCITTCRKHIATVGQSDPQGANPTPDDVERSCAVACFSPMYRGIPTGCLWAICFHMSRGLVALRSKVGTMVLAAQQLLPLLLPDTGAWAASGWLPCP
jgi:hypothetical protein